MGVGPTVHKILKTYTGRVRLAVRHNPYKYRDFARIAAEASFAAQEQGKFWEMHSMMLRKSPALSRNDLIKYAKDLGLDERKFTEALDKKQHDALIEKDIKLAQALDLYDTPTFFINGRKVVGNRSYGYLRRIIDEELRNANK